MSAYTEAIESLNEDLINIESKVVALRSKFSEGEKLDAEFIEVMDNMTSAFELLKLGMSKLDQAAGKERSPVK